MDKNLFFDSVEAAVSRGDVDTLVYLWKDAFESDYKMERQAYINGIIPSVASYLKLPSRPTLKEFVTDVYDPVQAYRALKDGTAIAYLQKGDIARYRNVMRFFETVLCDRNGNPDTDYLGEVLYYLLLVFDKPNVYLSELIKMNRVNGFTPCFDRLRLCVNVVWSLIGNWTAITNLFIYKPDKELVFNHALLSEAFVKSYLEKFFPKYGFDVIDELLHYMGYRNYRENGDYFALVINTLTRYMNLTAEETDELFRKILQYAKVQDLAYSSDYFSDDTIEARLYSLRKR